MRSSTCASEQPQQQQWSLPADDVAAECVTLCLQTARHVVGGCCMGQDVYGSNVQNVEQACFAPEIVPATPFFHQQLVLFSNTDLQRHRVCVPRIQRLRLDARDSSSGTPLMQVTVPSRPVLTPGVAFFS